MAEAETLQNWEQAEVARSRSEAAHTRIESLRLSEANLRRYMNPPADTPFPTEYVFHLLGDVSGKVVLDLGCGNGENSILLAFRRPNLVGIDVSESLLCLARRRFALNGVAGPAIFVASSAHDLALPDESVDVVVGIAILHHLDLKLAAREVNRILKPGGRAIFQEPVRESRALRFIRGLIPYRTPDVSPFERPLTEAELRMFARGLRACHGRAFSLPFVNVVAIVPFLAKWLPLAYRLDNAILKRAPFLRRYASTRVIELQKPVTKPN